jgi:hypothetical protein
MIHLDKVRRFQLYVTDLIREAIGKISGSLRLCRLNRAIATFSRWAECKCAIRRCAMEANRDGPKILSLLNSYQEFPEVQDGMMSPSNS